MKELMVGLGERSYPIFIEQNCLSRVGADLKTRQFANRYCVIADDNVAEIYGSLLMNHLEMAGVESQLVTFPQGEASKTLETVSELASKMAQLGFDRKDGIVALGGGVTGDIAGFLASSFMRGIPFVQVPTSLLAQVDSSVGGKTGVDIPEGKNLVGAFYQPMAVYIDTNVLKTLPAQEFLGGMAEVLKYGVIRDESFFDLLAEKMDSILNLEPDIIGEIIYVCCKIKAEVVEEDEKEGGARRILNYGHTIGHAVEGASNYSIIHGLAVAIGMVAAARLAVHNNYLSQKACDRIIEVLKNYKMETEVPKDLDRTLIKQYLLTDKKSVAGELFYVLPTQIGDTVITSGVTEAQVDDVLK